MADRGVVSKGRPAAMTSMVKADSEKTPFTFFFRLVVKFVVVVVGKILDGKYSNHRILFCYFQMANVFITHALVGFFH